MSHSAAAALAEGLERLRNDHESGSRELTVIALRIFRDVVVEMCHMDVRNEEAWDTIRMVSWHIWKNGRESMGAAVLNALTAMLADMETPTMDENDAEQRCGRLLSILDRHMERRKLITARIIESLTTYVRTNFMSREKITVLTLSASSTIRDSIVEAFGSLDLKTLDLRILESRPLYEGVSIAASILSKFDDKFGPSGERKLDMTIYTDASAAVASAGADILLLGSDRISESGAVSNKVGSLPAVLSAKHVSPGVKILVLSELEKVSEPGSVDDSVEEDDPVEVMNSWRSCGLNGLDILEENIAGVKQERNSISTVSVKNVYFEWVPPELIDAFVCEEGILEPGGIQERSQKIGDEMNRLFGGL